MALALSIGACERRADVGPVIVSAVSDTPHTRAKPGPTSDMAGRLLADSTAQGLVRFDAAGQIQAGVAERWIVTDEGRTFIFRLRELRWADSRPVRAADVVSILRRRIRARTPLTRYLTAIDSVVEMTPQVIQVELSWPRPDLLKLFAQPELAIVDPVRGIGTGPMRVADRRGRTVRLTPVPDSDRPSDGENTPQPEDDVLLVPERAAAGVARFAARQSDLFAGGTVAEWPLIAAAGIAPAAVRIDPAVGLFGLAIVNRAGFLESAENRAALALAIDRTALVRSFSADWPVAEDLLPAALDSARPPAVAPWQEVPAASRAAAAQARVKTWQAAGNPTPTIRIALPPTAGGTLLWARLAADLYAVGLRPLRVGWQDEADVRLVDAVAPYDSARWYLDRACQPCGEAAAALIDAARTAPTLAERARTIAAADTALAADIAFIPIARPLRWSLVTQRLRAWQPNDRAWHPLNQLRRNTN